MLPICAAPMSSATRKHGVSHLLMCVCVCVYVVVYVVSFPGSTAQFLRKLESVTRA